MSSYSNGDEPYGQKRKSFKSSGCFNCGETGHIARQCTQPSRKRNRRERSSSRSPGFDGRKRHREENNYSRRRSPSPSSNSRKGSEKYSYQERRKPYTSQSREFRRSRSRSCDLDSQGGSSTSSSIYSDNPRYGKDEKRNYQSRKSYADPRRRSQGLYNQYFPSNEANNDSWNSQYPPQNTSGYSNQNDNRQYMNSKQRNKENHSGNVGNNGNGVNQEESWDDGPTSTSSYSDHKENYKAVQYNNKQEPIINKNQGLDTNAEEESWD